MEMTSQPAFAPPRRGKLSSSKVFASRLLNSEPSVELHIDELVLHGFTTSDRYAIGDAVEGELARLFEKQGVPNSLRSESTADEIKGATFIAAQHAKPHAIGRQIASAVYQGFG
jgi:hypothetical protein